MDQEPVDILFIVTEEKVNYILSGDNDKKDDAIITDLIERLQKCQRIIESEASFSKNEEFDDISTGSIKYLAINYYIGKLHGQVMNLYSRKIHLIESRNSFNDFLEQCKQFRILDEEDDIKVNKSITAENTRLYKIAKYKREKETQKKMEVSVGS